MAKKHEESARIKLNAGRQAARPHPGYRLVGPTGASRACRDFRARRVRRVAGLRAPPPPRFSCLANDMRGRLCNLRCPHRRPPMTPAWRSSFRRREHDQRRPTGQRIPGRGSVSGDRPQFQRGGLLSYGKCALCRPDVWLERKLPMLTETARNRLIGFILTILLSTCTASFTAGIVFGIAPIQVLLYCLMAASATILTMMLLVAVN